MANIVIYGAEISGICAAIKARGNLLADNKEHNIKIIVTNPSGKLGGLATRGALNCWDVFDVPFMEYDKEAYQDDSTIERKCCQKGSFGYIANQYKQSYRTDMDSTRLGEDLPAGEMESMDIILEDMLAPVTKSDTLTSLGIVKDNITIEIIRAMDIVDIDFTTDESGNKTIHRLYLRSIKRSADGYIRWGRKTRVVEGDYFIDASDDGKLTSALTKVTVGRYDWPAETLEVCERTDIPVARQQAATLYFQVKNLAGTNKFIPSGGNDEINNIDPNNIFNGNNPLYEYNRTCGDKHLIKKYNLAKNSHLQQDNKDNIYWANTFLLFNVDGRAHYRDLTTKFYPKYMLSDAVHRDEAWVYGKNIIADSDDSLITALRRFKAFNNIEKETYEDENGKLQTREKRVISTGGEIVKNSDGPVVAEQLYIRESVHLPIKPGDIGNGTERTNYAVKRNQTLMTADNADQLNETKRIGFASYNADIHPYTRGDIIYYGEGSDYKFLEMAESANHMRPDLIKNNKNNGYIIKYALKDKDENKVTGEITPKDTYVKSKDVHGEAMPATYLPYNAMLPCDVTNLLVAGNASGVCSFSWGEVRVLPNLCVLGDAAGVAIAYAIRKGCSLKDINGNENSDGTLDLTHLNNIRSILKLNQLKKPDDANNPSVAEHNAKLLVDGKYWWTNDAIVDKTEIVKRGVKHSDFNTDLL